MTKLSILKSLKSITSLKYKMFLAQVLVPASILSSRTWLLSHSTLQYIYDFESQPLSLGLLWVLPLPWFLPLWAATPSLTTHPSLHNDLLPLLGCINPHWIAGDLKPWIICSHCSRPKGVHGFWNYQVLGSNSSSAIYQMGNMEQTTQPLRALTFSSVPQK